MRIQVERGETLLFDEHLSERTIYIGRQESCQVHLPGDETVAARHVMVLEEAGKWYVEPLHDQYHLTRLDGHLLRERQAIEDRAELAVADFKIVICPSDRTEDRTVAVQVIARSRSDLQETVGLSADSLGATGATVIKGRSETISLSKGWMEHIAALTLRMFEVDDVRALMSVVLDMLFDELSVGCAWVGLRTDEDGHLHLSTGRDLGRRSIDAPALAQRCQHGVVECGRSVLYQHAEELGDRSGMAAPLISPDGSLGMVYVENKPDRPKFSIPDLDILMFICTQIAVALDRILRVQTEQMEQRHSLGQDLARRVQSRVAPWRLPQWPSVKLGVLSEPGTGDCTDFYDVVPWGSDLGMILIGQVAENATDAAVSMSEVSSAFRIGAVHKDTPQVLMRQINWLVFGMQNEPRRISAGIVSLNPESGEFQICLVGKTHGYFVDTKGKVKPIKSWTKQLVGEARKAKYPMARGRLRPGQTLALATGGIFELTNAEGRTFQEQQVLDLLSDSTSQPVTGILTDLVGELTPFTSKRKPAKDLTVLLIRKEQ